MYYIAQGIIDIFTDPIVVIAYILFVCGLTFAVVITIDTIIGEIRREKK